jgi:hypothetical protein
VNTQDNTAPVITTCVSDKEVVLDGVSCDVALPDYTSEPELAITECSPYVVTQTPLAGTMISDTTVVTITVTDEYGNTDNCAFTVNTQDNTAPVITTCVSDKEVVLDGVSCDVALPDYTSEPELTITECSPYVVTQTPLAGTMISDTTVVTITVTDEYNNISTCQFSVNTQDNTAPVITTCVSDKEVVLDGVSCDVALPDYTSEPELAITECGVYTVTQSPAIGTMISDTTVVTITVTDEYGNTDNCTFTVNTQDNTAPVITTCVSDKEVVL